MDDSHVREAWWGEPRAFSTRGKLFQTIARLAALRRDWEPLRRGTQFFRPVSGDGHHFGLSETPGGILAYSRLWEGREVLIAANTGSRRTFRGEIILDYNHTDAGAEWQVLWSSRPKPAAPGRVLEKAAREVTVCEEDGAVTQGSLHTLPVTVRAGEVQILVPACSCR